jgi:asparagine synthase (glutamine-hydrolysing)
MYVDVKTWLPDAFLEKVDKATMAFGLEGRLPFLDHRLVELAFRIPPEEKISMWSTKRVLKRAVAKLVPAFVLEKRKHGFAVPTNEWFKGPLQKYIFDVLMDDQARRRGFFNFSTIEKLYRSHVSGQEVNDWGLWTLVNFELWHREFIDRLPEVQVTALS